MASYSQAVGFDATMIQIGAYSEFWPDIHMTPAEGLRAHVDPVGLATDGLDGRIQPQP